MSRGLWTMTACARSASARLSSPSWSTLVGSEVVKTKGGQVLWQRDTKSWTSLMLETRHDRYGERKRERYTGNVRHTEEWGERRDLCDDDIL